MAMLAVRTPRNNYRGAGWKRTGSPGGGQQADEGQDNQRDAASHRRGPQKSAENTAQSIWADSTPPMASAGSRLRQQGEELARIARLALQALVVQRPPPPPDDLDVHLAGGGFPRRATVADYVHVGRVLLELSV